MGADDHLSFGIGHDGEAAFEGAFGADAGKAGAEGIEAAPGDGEPGVRVGAEESGPAAFEALAALDQRIAKAGKEPGLAIVNPEACAVELSLRRVAAVVTAQEFKPGACAFETGIEKLAEAP